MMKRVLLVEDSPMMAKVMTYMLRQELQVTPVVTTTLAETREYFEHGALADVDHIAAIVDLHLPDAPNGEALDYVLSQGIPVIVLTASDDQAQRDTILKKGVVDYMVKEGRFAYEYVVRLVRRLDQNRHMHVLVVDDSLATRGLVSSLLRLFRFQVHEAVDGQQALRIYSQHPAIELVVTDFEMPMMDGVELVKALRQKQGPNSLPIIGISGGDKGEISARFIKSGANDFLRKPFSVEEFNCRIIQCIESVEQIRALHRAATSDALTGLSNRRHFFEQGEPQLKRAVQRQQALHVAMLDLDHFKQINDRYGHDGGDAVLVRVAELLRAHFSDYLCARLGGEEFAIVFEALQSDQVQAQLESFRQQVCSVPVQYQGQRIDVSVSIGLNSVGENLDALLKGADQRLYRAKAEGRNRLIC